MKDTRTTAFSATTNYPRELPSVPRHHKRLAHHKSREDSGVVTSGGGGTIYRWRLLPTMVNSRISGFRRTGESIGALMGRYRPRLDRLTVLRLTYCTTVHLRVFTSITDPVNCSRADAAQMRRFSEFPEDQLDVTRTIHRVSSCSRRFCADLASGRFRRIYARCTNWQSPPGFPLNALLSCIALSSSTR